MTKQSFAILLAAWCEGSLSAEESAQFSTAVNSGEYDEWIEEFVESQLDTGVISSSIKMENKEQLLAGLLQAFGEQQSGHTIPVHRVHFLKTAWSRWAAVVMIAFGVGAYLFFDGVPPNSEVVSDRPTALSNDILPGFNKAILTISNGQRINLDSTASQTIHDGPISITNADGRLSYSDGHLTAINTMSTPKGGQYKLTLADGTKVWLNAASSITYPTTFTGEVREVSISGEVYFEVVSNSKQPFIVKTSKEEIRVLGTSFNINAYTDENAFKTSLVEGAVKIGGRLLKPGQAFINGQIATTNVQQDIAWKGGVFNFNNVSVEALMRQINRWYNVEVMYEGRIPDIELVGEAGRNLTLLQMLEVLSMAGLKCQLEGKTVKVRS